MIAFDINEHFLHNYKTKGSHFKAMLATNSKKEAIRYLEAFEELGDLNCAVVISPPDQREGHHEVDESTDDIVQRFWKRMMDKYGNGKLTKKRSRTSLSTGMTLICLLSSINC